MAPSTPTGTVVRDGDRVVLEFVRTWEVPGAGVWSALTDSDRLGRWSARWSGDPASGTVRVTTTGEGDGAEPQPATIDACERSHRLAVTTGGAGRTGRSRSPSPTDPAAGRPCASRTASRPTTTVPPARADLAASPGVTGRLHETRAP